MEVLHIKARGLLQHHHVTLNQMNRVRNFNIVEVLLICHYQSSPLHFQPHPS